MEVCLFSSALPGWEPARVARAALDAGLTAVEWGVGANRQPGEREAIVGTEAQRVFHRAGRCEPRFLR